mmetsp:Transcript_26435/g.57931  ORF Transcript_26435/g.57931 Transcript_26435/m.57931 type:complete len:244 (-) Transcript_26435:19-750(-)
MPGPDFSCAYYRMLSSPTDSMNPSHRLSDALSFFLAIDSVISGVLSYPSWIWYAADSGTHSPLRMQLHTEYPKTETVTDVLEMAKSMAPTGCPRSPSIDSVASMASEDSSHKHPSSLTDSTRDVLWYPLVVILKSPKSSAGIGLSRSSIVKPRSLTSMLVVGVAWAVVVAVAVEIVLCVARDGEKAATEASWGDADAIKTAEKVAAAMLVERLGIMVLDLLVCRLYYCVVRYFCSVTSCMLWM